MTDLPSTRPYLIRALHDWCMDHGFTPYLAVAVDGSVRVPLSHVVNGEIVLNVGTDATGGLVIGNEFIDFKARFGGVPQEISVPVGRVLAIYARENGQGMSFPVQFDEAKVSTKPSFPNPKGSVDEVLHNPSGLALVDAGEAREMDPEPQPPASPGAAGKSKPVLKRVK